ncbi:MAG: YebC/PmpR family DNA-binding transcriptional regulator [Rickettsiales bacterium]|jgi:YebC/PmpR family DNA-binding regulatory protein|nr:YebC/PmpR family DNA-binding transcriptional regulator [Rickettsiales bacterium]
MSGHSKWATTKHKKAIIDAKRAKNFTKLLKEITVAAKLGDPNPDFNPRLRTAVIAAKAASVPKDNIANAIKKGAGLTGSGNDWEELKYEGYGPGGIALIIEVLTDNRNRSASNVRSALTKFSGNLGESGSVSFMFDKVGVIGFEGKVASEEEMLEEVINAGGDNVESSSEYHEITTSVENFIKVRDVLMLKFGEPEEASIRWMAKDPVIIIDVEKARTIEKLIEKLEDDEDVQNVYSNHEIDKSIEEQL